MSYYKNFQPKESSTPLPTQGAFLEDWEEVRDRHSGQKEILHKIFSENKKTIFVRAGRKGAKSTTNIDIAWRFAWEKPRSVIYLCFPTITQGIEVLWDERRLQTCDCPEDDYMTENYIRSIDNAKHILWFKNGSHIKLIGTWNEARGRGTQPDVLIIDEVQDCDGSYIDAMRPNLGAKDGVLIMSGTPPRKRNHYHEWEKRIACDPNGATFHYSSYVNDRLPHLKEWLDKEREILVKSGKEDVWVREYMAEDCFSSADRVLPDAKFLTHDLLVKEIIQWPKSKICPIMSAIVHPSHITVIWGILFQRQKLYILDYEHVNQLWDKSLSILYENLLNKLNEFTLTFDLQHRRTGGAWRKVVYDPTNSFSDVIGDFSACRKDFKWQERGIPLLREKMHTNSIIFSDRFSDFGLECQNLLLEDQIKDVEKSYPMVCDLAMLVNEFFQIEIKSESEKLHFDKYSALLEMGLPIPPQKRRKNTIFTKNW